MDIIKQIDQKFDALEAKVKSDVLLAVQIILLRESTARDLSRLIELDPDKAGDYHAALGAIGK